jgi:hypothetical protein
MQNATHGARADATLLCLQAKMGHTWRVASSHAPSSKQHAWRLMHAQVQMWWHTAHSSHRALHTAHTAHTAHSTMKPHRALHHEVQPCQITRKPCSQEASENHDARALTPAHYTRAPRPHRAHSHLMCTPCACRSAFILLSAALSGFFLVGTGSSGLRYSTPMMFL